MRARFFFWIPIVLFWIAALAAIFIHDRVSLHLALNAWHHPLADRFFMASTHFGGGFAVLALVLLSLKKNRRLLLEFLIGFGFAITTVALFKYLVWPDAPRPSALIDGLKLVPGFKNDDTRSFPSGHTTTVFCIGVSLAHYQSKKFARLFLALACILVGYSRIYLSQHFLMDVFVGSMLGTLGAIFGRTLVRYFQANPQIQKFMTLDDGPQKIK
jgi:membrane-associated phospholipid phosphatase